jgi:DNA helicase II / ATP-dependent DNA helicase PcrA
MTQNARKPALPSDPPLSPLAQSLKALNPSQLEAVETFGRPLLVLAGAGSGKTRVLTTKLALILQERDTRPFQVLAVTFTNKAAQEMRHRVQHLIKEPLDAMWLGTFHGISSKILRKNADLLGYSSQFTILDTGDQLRLLKQILKQLGLDEKKYPPKVVLNSLSRWKDKGFSVEKIVAASTRDALSDVKPDKQMVAVYQCYQERLKVLNAVDFGDLILLCLELFNQNPDILHRYREQFCYILVDEYQDINISQYLWLRFLSKDNPNICLVGDDDQSIYGWRGAEVENMLRFEKDFPQGQLIRLEENYRSTFHILGAASSLIAKNKRRLGKALKTEQTAGEKVSVKGLWNDWEEAKWIGEELSRYRKKNVPLGDMAILVRTSSQTRAFEERFILQGVPYRVVGNLRFYDRLEIRDMVAYLRVVQNPDDSLAFERILNTPKRGIGLTTLQTLQQVAMEENISLFKAADRLVLTDAFRGNTKITLKYLINKLQDWQACASHVSCAELAKKVMDESGYLAFWKQEKSLEAEGRLENLKELLKALEAFESLQIFLEHVSLVTDMGSAEEGDFISLMTLHTAKGLEFGIVFLPGWEENLFPHVRALDEKGDEGLEEERRLAYVGLTRAKDKAIISFAWNRRLNHMGPSSCVPSRFIKEIEDTHLDLCMGAQSSPSRSDARPFSWQKTAQDRTPRPNTSTAQSHQFIKQQKIFHTQFGYGTVQGIEGECLDILFDHAGSKKIVARFLKPA